MRSPVRELALGLLCLAFCGCTALQTTTQRVALQVTSSASAVRVGEETQFAISTSSAVSWRVNGVMGGNPVTGTIDSSGRYQAPAEVPSPNVVVVSASSAEGSAEAKLSILNPVPRIDSASVAIEGTQMTITVNGFGFVKGAAATVDRANEATRVDSPTRLTVTATARTDNGFVVAIANPQPGAAGSNPYSVMPTRAVRPLRTGANGGAARLLDQATFGPVQGDILALQSQFDQLGVTSAINNWVGAEALAVPSSWPVLTSIPASAGGNQLCGDLRVCLQYTWYQNALTGQDQLRQRMGFALSQIWVTSGVTVQASDSLTTWYKILNDDAFGNYRQVMEDVTLSSSMGFYLDMGNSAKPIGGNIANENYARELLQLFTLGVYRLNDDGSYLLDGNGETVATYSEADIQNFARVFTGWTYKRATGTQDWNRSFTSSSTERTAPMVAVPSQHDTGSKLLLAGSPTEATIAQNDSPSTNTMAAELDQALDAIFDHPNLPPFVCRQMIQHFVTSNPSPAYVARVSQVFKNNGSGVRGDMKAMIKAILTDPEARMGDSQLRYDSFGHLREPALYMTAIIRGLGFSTANAVTFTNSQLSMTNLGSALPGQGSGMSQNVLFSPSVFNYFSPDYALTSNNLVAPEFQLMTSATAPIRANFADSVVRNAFTSSAIDVSGSVDALAAIATAAPDAMVDQINRRFMYGQMSISMKQAAMNAVTGLPGGSLTVADTNNRYRARLALYLVLSSSQYQIIH